MIRNDDKIGNYFVNVFAQCNAIAGFQCPTLDDVYSEVGRIASERQLRSLPTTKATARRLVERSGKRRQFGEPFEVMIAN